MSDSTALREFRSSLRVAQRLMTLERSYHDPPQHGEENEHRWLLFRDPAKILVAASPESMRLRRCIVS